MFAVKVLGSSTVTCSTRNGLLAGARQKLLISDWQFDMIGSINDWFDQQPLGDNLQLCPTSSISPTLTSTAA